ncbi:hypothetical protein ASPTUDRAFT_934488 [Aspergillus tubingensis CBS 134.48]|uniref:Uncharacterized protein n=1 Tax=Aspergillus tubingensis (strain CBS 134.48) TaxID=767770 RepID=A0A1L9MZ29_ASPTC|nr:hypothetical protein ASPTUDRAFT_934488 [Aspergillus tubingensis CBS 134.48]
MTITTPPLAPELYLTIPHLPAILTQASTTILTITDILPPALTHEEHTIPGPPSPSTTLTISIFRRNPTHYPPPKHSTTSTAATSQPATASLHKPTNLPPPLPHKPLPPTHNPHLHRIPPSHPRTQSQSP